MKTYKHENVAVLGEAIKVCTLLPTDSQSEEFFVGLVILKTEAAYLVDVIESPEYPKKVGTVIYVPFEKTHGEHDDRVTVA